MFIFRVLIMIVGLVGCFNAFADTGCPIGYGYQPPMVFVGDNLNGGATTIGGISNTGEQISDSHYRTNSFTGIPVEIGKSYTVATNESKSSILLATYDANHNFIERVNISNNNYICSSGVSYVVPMLYVNDENKWQYSVTDTEILFLDTPLRKVGDYADELDLNKGQIIRNVGVKVFDGTEDWQSQQIPLEYAFGPYISLSDWGAAQLLDRFPNYLYCSHFKNASAGLSAKELNIVCPNNSFKNMLFTVDNRICGNDLDSWKAWLAQQYAAGTPVTIYYPLATPVIESFNFSSYTRYELPVIDGDCSLCPPNTYKDFVGNEQCTPCPDRLISPSGATSVNECGRVLRVDGHFTFMPVGRRTEHGLCTMLDGVKYCADLYEKK